METRLAVAVKTSPIGSIHADMDSIPSYRTLLLNRVATKAATTTMETTILTAVETLVAVILNVVFLRFRMCAEVLCTELLPFRNA
jgi:hypothetical protein